MPPDFWVRGALTAAPRFRVDVAERYVDAQRVEAVVAFRADDVVGFAVKASRRETALLFLAGFGLRRRSFFRLFARRFVLLDRERQQTTDYEHEALRSYFFLLLRAVVERDVSNIRSISSRRLAT
mgnify:CR=1 FL=1